jgi:hypothetical protein
MSLERLPVKARYLILGGGAFVATLTAGSAIMSARNAEGSTATAAPTQEYTPPTGEELKTLINQPAQWSLRPLLEKIQSLTSQN